MSKIKSKEMAIHSLARWLAGLEPMFGPRHYFERFSKLKKVAEKLLPYRGLLICPFCKKRLVRASAFVNHMIKIHYRELEELVDNG